MVETIFAEMAWDTRGKLLSIRFELYKKEESETVDCEAEKLEGNLSFINANLR